MHQYPVGKSAILRKPEKGFAAEESSLARLFVWTGLKISARLSPACSRDALSLSCAALLQQHCFISRFFVKLAFVLLKFGNGLLDRVYE